MYHASSQHDQHNQTRLAAQSLRRRADGAALTAAKVKEICKEQGLPTCALAVIRLDLNCQVCMPLNPCPMPKLDEPSTAGATTHGAAAVCGAVAASGLKHDIAWGQRVGTQAPLHEQ